MSFKSEIISGIEKLYNDFIQKDLKSQTFKNILNKIIDMENVQEAEFTYHYSRNEDIDKISLNMLLNTDNYVLKNEYTISIIFDDNFNDNIEKNDEHKTHRIGEIVFLDVLEKQLNVKFFQYTEWYNDDPNDSSHIHYAYSKDLKLLIKLHTSFDNKD